jgi:hypothetical protein
MKLVWVIRTILYFLIVYIPFEAFLLKWIPVSEQSYLVLRQIPDLLVVFAFALLVISKTETGSQFKLLGYGIDKYLVAFLILITTYALLSGANMFLVILNMKALVRYVLIAYIIVNISLKDYHFSKMVYLIEFSIGIQVIIGLLQVALGPSFSMFFLPRLTAEEIGGVKIVYTSLKELGLSQGIFGTMIRTIEYGLFLIVGLILWQVKFQKSTVRYWIGIMLFLFLIYWSGSRAIFLVGLISVIIHQYYLGKIGTKVVLALLLTLVLLVPLLLMDLNFSENYVLEVFSKDYIDLAKKQRLGILLVMLPEFFKDGLIHIFFGYSADHTLLFERFRSIENRPSLLMKSAAPIEDVYWIALLYYYGITGLFLLILFFYRIWRVIKTQFMSSLLISNNKILFIAVILLLLTIPLNFFNQAFEVRHFSFYLWLVIGIALRKAKTSNH